MLRIAVVTGTRADYGLLFPLISLINDSDNFELLLIVCGQHLSPEFGYTRQFITKDGFDITDDIEMAVNGETPAAITKSVGLGCIGFAESFQKIRPDIVLLLGDRYEILAAAQAAMFASIPIAHLHGGEITEGAIDESIRHAITKMSHLHFVAAEEYRERVLQLGENPLYVYNVGAIGLDNIINQNRTSKSDIENQLNEEISDMLFLVTYHPETLSESSKQNSIHKLFAALDDWQDVTIVITGSNSDVGGSIINKEINEYKNNNKGRVIVRSSLGQKLYLDLMSICNCVIGNSSSGIIEAPSFSVPTVNIGDRQKGRLRAKSIIDCKDEIFSIKEAIEQALSLKFRKNIENTTNPFGDGDTAEKIMTVLESVDLNQLKRKPFFSV